MATQKKLTLAHFKKFIAANRDRLLVNCKASFDAMTDCVSYRDGCGFTPATETDNPHANNFGLRGVWCVLRGRDWFQPFETECDLRALHVQLGHLGDPRPTALDCPFQLV